MTRIPGPIRGITSQLSRLSTRPNALPSRCTHISTFNSRPISTSTPSKASLTPITTSVDNYVPVKPFEEQSVLATIHQFPSLEPVRFETYPANHLNLQTRRDILHRAVIYEGDMTRLGTASTKTRYEVRGSRRKVRPQKGTGHARLGDKNSPMLRGGGVAFGPKPRDFATELPKKVYDLAWRTALSYRWRKGELIIVDNAIEIESPSTRLLSDIFKYHDKQHGKGRSLLVTLEERPMLEQALEEMDRAEQVQLWDEVDVKNLLELQRVIIERDALHNILLAHQADLTSVVTPRGSFIRSSPASELESLTGWSEFRGLMLSEGKDKDASRAVAYEGVAESRYKKAKTLPEGPERVELTVSAYNLLAEAKQLQFAEQTGFAWSEYLRLGNDDSTIAMFPRIQAVDYQISVKKGQQDQAISPKEQQVPLLAIRELEVQRHEILYQAALLAAQIHEHVAESIGFTSGEEEAVNVWEMASSERTNVVAIEQELLAAKLELARQELIVATANSDYAAQRKAQEDIDELKPIVEQNERDALAEAGGEEGTDIIVDDANAPKNPIY